MRAHHFIAGGFAYLTSRPMPINARKIFDDGMRLRDREAFERWIEKQQSITKEGWSQFGDGYVEPTIDKAWRAWLAGCAHARKSAPRA
jgi:hypothetical protein